MDESFLGQCCPDSESALLRACSISESAQACEPPGGDVWVETRLYGAHRSRPTTENM